MWWGDCAVISEASRRGGRSTPLRVISGTGPILTMDRPAKRRATPCLRSSPGTVSAAVMGPLPATRAVPWQASGIDLHSAGLKE
jgi:hypothetical protein